MSPTPGKWYVNNNLSNFWLLGEGATVIPQNADMHNYITPGNYSCSTSRSISTLKNCPVNAAFIMKAYYSNGGGDPNYVYLIQEYITFDGKQRALSIYNNEAGKITWSTVKYPTKDDLTPAFTKVGSSYGLEAYHAAIGKLHILRLAGNVTSAFSNFNLALPDSCDGYFISEPGKVGDISYTIEINSKHLIVTPSTSVPVDKYFVHWLIYYGY